MARPTAAQKKAEHNAELAAERASIVDRGAPEVVEEVDDLPAAKETWRRLQKQNSILNPWMSPTFLVEMWSQASDIEVPLLAALPSGAEIGELRKACGLSVAQLAERAAVTEEMWTAFEHGDGTVLEHVNANSLLRFVSALDACVIAGGPPSPAPSEPAPERQPMTVVGAELLADVAREAGDRFPLSHVVIDDRLSRRIAEGEIPSPTATAFPSERQMVEIVRGFPGLANRRRTVAWTSSSLLQDLVEREPTDAEFIPRDELEGSVAPDSCAYSVPLRRLSTPTPSALRPSERLVRPPRTGVGSRRPLRLVLALPPLRLRSWWLRPNMSRRGKASRMQIEVSEALSAAFGTLDERQAAVLKLLYIDGRSFRDTARELGVTARTILRVRDKAVAALKAAMPGVDGYFSVEPQSTSPPPQQAAMVVAWATCRRCLREGVGLNEDDFCGVCGPIVVATQNATLAGSLGARQRRK